MIELIWPLLLCGKQRFFYAKHQTMLFLPKWLMTSHSSALCCRPTVSFPLGRTIKYTKSKLSVTDYASFPRAFQPRIAYLEPTGAFYLVLKRVNLG